MHASSCGMDASSAEFVTQQEETAHRIVKLLVGGAAAQWIKGMPKGMTPENLGGCLHGAVHEESTLLERQFAAMRVLPLASLEHHAREVFRDHTSDPTSTPNIAVLRSMLVPSQRSKPPLRPSLISSLAPSTLQALLADFLPILRPASLEKEAKPEEAAASKSKDRKRLREPEVNIPTPSFGVPGGPPDLASVWHMEPKT